MAARRSNSRGPFLHRFTLYYIAMVWLANGLLCKMLALVPQLAAQHNIAVAYDADGTPTRGYKTLINSGPDGGQEVYHLHMHLVGGARPWRGMRT